MLLHYLRGDLSELAPNFDLTVSGHCQDATAIRGQFLEPFHCRYGKRVCVFKLRLNSSQDLLHTVGILSGEAFGYCNLLQHALNDGVWGRHRQNTLYL
jgi:hypothetical protein